MNKPQYASIAGPIGYVVDLALIARSRFRNPHSYTKFRQIVALGRETGATTLIETGTYLGVTTQRCVRHFSKVMTVELDEELAAAARARLARFPNCEVIQGDASAVVREQLARPELGDRILLFLDGHFSGGITALGDQAEPALDILDTLANHADRIVGVIVDDFREFGTQPGWPSKGNLVSRAERLFCSQGFELRVHLDQLILQRRNGRR